MTTAGQMRDKLVFEERQLDGNGDRLGAWADQFTVFAHLLPLRGGESVLAARLKGNQPYAAAIYDSTESRRITTDWRARDARNAARTFNIRSVAPQLDRRTGQPTGFLDVLLEEGRADGL